MLNVKKIIHSYVLSVIVSDYKYLGILNQQFSGVPILGLTATASSHVLHDVKNILHLHACIVFRSTFNRPNLFYEVTFN